MLFKQVLLKFLFLSVSLLLPMYQSIASPAFPGYIDYPLSNGETVKLSLRGDEDLSWYESVNKNIFIAEGQTLYYATFDSRGQAYDHQTETLVASPYPLGTTPPTGFKVLNAEDPTVIEAIKAQHLSEHLQSVRTVSAAEQFALINSANTSLNQPRSDTNRTSEISDRNNVSLLVVALSFSDVQLQGSTSFWQDLVFNITADYFSTASRGQFNFQKARETQGIYNDGLIEVHLPEAHPNAFRGSTPETLSSALQAIDQYIDFKHYDTNGDGLLKTEELNILFVFAGWEASISGQFQGPSVWGHVSRLPSDVSVDGVSFDARYARVGERHVDRLSTFGIVAHELGHLTFNWPDLYDLSPQSRGNNALGRWGLMASGSWNAKLGEFSGATPALPNPILRHQHGWETQRLSSGAHRLTPLSDGGHALKVETSNNNHYAFLEVKGKNDFDAPHNLAEPSLLVWRYRSSGSNSQRESYNGSLILPSFELSSNEPNSEGTPSYLLSSNRVIWPTNQGANKLGTSTNPNLHVTDARDDTAIYLQAWDLNDIARQGDGSVQFLSSKTNNVPPIIALDAPENVFLDTVLVLDASESRDQDGDIVEYRWQGPWGNEVTTTPIFDAIFTQEGSTNFSLSVVDNERAVTNQDFTINVVNRSTAPVAVIAEIANTTINLADRISFQAFDSFDPKPDSRITGFRWIGPWGDFPGAPYFQHQFLTAGVFTITLEVRDQYGNTGRDTVEITVVDDGMNLPPVAVLDEDQSQVIGNAYFFNGARSFDEDGLIERYSWEGPWGVRQGRAFFYTFFEVGVFPIKLTVTDNEGSTHSTTQTFTITKKPLKQNYEQVYMRGSFYSWSNTAMQLVEDNLWETTATVPEGEQQRFKFDIYRDWSLNYGDNNASDQSYTLERNGADIYLTQGAGRYVITFNDSTYQYSVRKLPVNRPPIAISGGDITANVNEVIVFDASASSDSDGEIVSYLWSNGMVGVMPSLSYSEPGIYSITLTVTDNADAYSRSTFTVTIIDPDRELLSTYDSMHLRGTFNTWSTTEMALVRDHIWEVEVEFDVNTEYKFDVSADWSINYGDNNADQKAERDANNILAPAASGRYRLEFNDLTKEYLIIDL